MPNSDNFSATSYSRQRASNCFVHTDTFTLTGALTDDDVISFLNVNKGTVIHQIFVNISDLDTDGSPTATIDVGDLTNDDRFVVNSVAAQAGGFITANVNILPYTYTTSDTLTVTVESQATAATSGFITMTVIFSDPNHVLSNDS
jgi:hypothetical protein